MAHVAVRNVAGADPVTSPALIAPPLLPYKVTIVSLILCSDFIDLVQQSTFLNNRFSGRIPKVI